MAFRLRSRRQEPRERDEATPTDVVARKPALEESGRTGRPSRPVLRARANCVMSTSAVSGLPGGPGGNAPLAQLRQRHREGRTLALAGALRANAPAVQFDDVLRDEKANFEALLASW